MAFISVQRDHSLNYLNVNDQCYGRMKTDGPLTIKNSASFRLKDFEGMICDILFLYARDSEQIKNDLLQQLRGVFAHCVCVDDPEFSCQDALKNFTQVKLQVVFFSPGFLEFLEFRVQEAYECFCGLDPQSTVALFCCGLLERMIFCYHTAPLKSYSSWPKYEHMSEQMEGSTFSPFFLGLFQEFLPDQNRTQEGVLIVPEMINKESSSVYIVFSEAIEIVEEFTVHLEAGSKIQIAPECLNQYTLYFKVPVTILDSCKSIDVRIKQSGRVIAVKNLTVVSTTESNEWKNTEANNKERIKLRNKEVEDSLYSNYTGSTRSSEESLCTISHSHDSGDGTYIRKKYEERNTFSGHPNSSDDLSRPYFMRNSSNEQVNCLEDFDDTYGYPAVYRSVSLPSIITEPDLYRNLDPIYLPMTPIYHHSDQNLSTSNPSLNDSSSYVYMRFRGNVPQRDFGGSQQEIPQTFPKETSRCNKGNRMRRKKPVESPNSSGNDKRGKTKFDGKDRRRGIRRSTLPTDSDSGMGSKRNSFNDSSSSSSKASDVSNCTVQSWKFSESPRVTDEAPTNAFSNYEAARESTLSNGSKPQLINEDSSLYRTRYTNSKLPKPSFDGNEFIRRDSEDKEKVESLIKVCERYGLQHLGDYFISGCPDNVDILKDYDVQGPGERDAFNIECFEISGEWDQDTIPSLKRSFSLPSTLFPTESALLLEDNLDDGYDDVRYPDDAKDSLTCSCEDYINAFHSGIYMSLMQDINRNEPQNSVCPVDTCKSINDHCSYTSGIYMSLIPVDSNEKVKSYVASNSQEELLELMDAYKRGDKTISQVEQQFQQWHLRHMTATSNRDKQLVHLRDEYERAQKQGKSRLKEFILRKPKPGRKDNKKTSYENNRSEKKKVGKSNSDTKHLRKISAASTSSGGTSDNSDSLKWCYDNPGYVGTQNVQHGKKFKPFCCPPPLPPRPPLTPIAVMRTLVVDQKSQSSEEEKTPPTKSESPQIGKQKPSPPPKPPDVFKKLRCYRPGDAKENELDKQGEQATENEENRPDSPDYIIPNIVRRVPPRTERKLVRPNPTCPLHCPVPGLHFYAKVPHDPASCPATLNNSGNANKDAPKRLSWNLLLKEAIPNPFAGFYTAKTKKVEMSKFYVARKWSSFPRLDSSQFHTYLELQEIWDNRNRLNNDSSSPVD